MPVHLAIHLALACRDELALLVPPTDLAGPQCALQRPRNLHDLHADAKRQRDGLVAHDTVDEFLQSQLAHHPFSTGISIKAATHPRLGLKSILKPLPILLLHLMADAALVTEHHIVRPWH